MSKYKIITFSGIDRIGKETQSNLLGKVLSPSIVMSFPNYDHWTGKIIKSLLYSEPFSITTSDGVVTTHTEKKSPLTFQYLQEINRLEHQDIIKQKLQHSHIIMDRYDIDSVAYGYAEGCNLGILLEFSKQRLSSDIIIILTGSNCNYFRFNREDQNEKDTKLQERVREAFLTFSAMEPYKYLCINVDDFSSSIGDEEDKHRSILGIHTEVCSRLSPLLGIDIRPIEYAKITY